MTIPSTTQGGLWIHILRTIRVLLSIGPNLGIFERSCGGYMDLGARLAVNLNLSRRLQGETSLFNDSADRGIGVVRYV